jgi:hypothetical protein
MVTGYEQQAPLPQAGIRHSLYPQVVASRMLAVTPGTTPMDNLAALKRIMRDAAWELSHVIDEHRPRSTDERLTIVAKTLRAVEDRNMNRLREALLAMPALREEFGLSHNSLPGPAQLSRLRDHAVELARTQIWDRIEELRSLRHTLPEYEVHHRKTNILADLRRFLPGSGAGLKALSRSTADMPTTDTEQMAALLKEHWGRVFTAKPTMRHQLRKWVGDELNGHPLPEPTSKQWRLTRAHILQAISSSNDSAPGPDGIPYRAWRACVEVAAPILQDVATWLQGPGTDSLLPDDFNRSFLCCLPK